MTERSTPAAEPSAGAASGNAKIVAPGIGRWVGGLAAIAAAVTGALWVCASVPDLAAGQTVTFAPPAQLTLAPAAVTLVCAASPAEPEGTDTGIGPGASEVTGIAAAAELRSGATGAVSALGDATASIGQLTADPMALWQGDQAATVAGTDEALVMRATAAASTTSGALPVATAGGWSARGALRGVTAQTCQAPAADQWITAGSASDGSVSTLRIVNPSATTATVTVSVWGSTGMVPDGAVRPLVLAPGSSQEVVLGAISPLERRFAVRVQSEGAAVAATISEVAVDGVVPRGVLVAVPGSDPATVQAIAGVVVGGDESEPASLRLLAPDAATAVRIDLLGPDGRTVMLGAESVDLEAGRVLDVPLTGVPAGVYTVLASAASPIVAAARSVSAGPMLTSTQAGLDVDLGQMADAAWTPGRSIESLIGESGTASSAVAVPDELTSTLTVTALPASAAEAATAVGELPIVYADAALDGAGGDADAGDGEAAQQGMAPGDAQPGSGGQVTGTVTAYDRSGTIIHSQELSLAWGSSSTVALPLISGEAAAVALWTVEVDDQSGSAGTLAWAVSAESVQVPGSLTTLVPVTATSHSSTVEVMRAP